MGLLDLIRTSGSVLEGVIFGGLGGKQGPGHITVTHQSEGLPFSAWDEGVVDRVDPRRLRQLYRISGWVHSAVALIAEAQAMARLTVFENDEQELDHPFLQLMRSPNPHMTKYDLMFHRAASEELAGNAYWMMFFDPREDLDIPDLNGARFTFPPTSIWPVMPQMVRPIVSRNEFITGYKIDTGSTQFTVPAAQMIHFRRYDPESLTVGMPGLRAIYSTAMADADAARYQQTFNKFAMRPPVAFTTSEEMDIEEARELKRELVQTYGGAQHAGEPMVLWSGLTPIKLSFSPQETEIVAQRKASRDEILGGFRVSKSMLGLTDDVNRATAEAMDFVFAKRVTQPKLVAAQERITSDILMRFYSPDLRAEFVDVVPSDQTLNLKKMEQLVKGGAVTKDELRKELMGWPELPDGQGEELAIGRVATRTILDGGEDDESLAAGQKSLLEMMRAGSTLDELEEFVDSQQDLQDAVAALLREQEVAIVDYVRRS